MFNPYSIKHRSYIIDKVRRIGYKAFLQPDSEMRGHFGEYFDESLFSISQDHVLGTEAQFNNGEATCYYDGSGFTGFTAFTRRFESNQTNSPVTLTFADYDRFTIVITTLDRSIVFPDKFLLMKNYSVLDMAGFDITIPGRTDGELNLTGSGSTLNLSGQTEGLIVNQSLITINFTGTGSYFNNGILTT